MSKRDDFGIPALFRQLEGLEKKIRNKALRRSVREGAKIIAARVRKEAPEDTGKVKRSVKVRAGKRRKNQISAEVVVSGGHDDPMIGQVEFGNKFITANPFIRRSVAAEKEAALDVIEQSLRDEIAG